MKLKNIINGLVLVALLFVASSCDPENGRVTFDGPYYVQFTGSGSTISEEMESTTVIIEVSNVGPTKNEDIVVSYSTEGSTAVEGVDFDLAAGQTSGQIVIPAGKHFGTLKLNTIDNLDADGVKSLKVTLTSASGGLDAGRGAIGLSYTLTINDNDCPLDLDTFAGSYDMDFTHTAGFLWAAGFQSGFVSTLIPTTDANIFDCENFFGIVDRDALGSLGSELGLIPIYIDDVAETAAIAPYPDGKTGHYFYSSGGTAPREIQGVSAGPVATCGPDFSLSANVVRTAEQTVGTSITVMNFRKLD